MLFNFIKIALRNLLTHKGYSIINILGLAAGFTACLVIALYIGHETSYDSFHDKKDRIYRVAVEHKKGNEESRMAQTAMPTAAALEADFPEVEDAVRIYFSEYDLAEYNDKHFIENEIIFADSTFLEMFSFEVINGDAGSMLDAPFSIILTESAAKKYFDNENPLGRQLELNNKEFFTITGVIKDVPLNSHFRFDMAASYSSLTKEYFGWDPSKQWWSFFGSYTYILLNEKSSGEEFEKKTKDWLHNKAGNSPDSFSRIFLQPLTGIHLNSDNDLDIGTGSTTKQNMVVLGIIALSVLVIACINFINLTTARSARRAREVGVRKTLGAYRSSLIKQFIGEAIVVVFISFILSIVLVELTLPALEVFAGVEIHNNLWSNIQYLPYAFIIVLLTGAAAGAYPSIILSKFRPAIVIKGNNFLTAKKQGGSILRRVLAVSQFSISIILISGTLIINQQLDFLRNSDLGFKKDHIIQIELNDDKVKEKAEEFKNELRSITGVKSATSSLKAPIGDNNIVTNIYPNGRGAGGNFSVHMNFVDTGFINHYNLSLIEGRGFSGNLAADKNAFIVNETLLKALGVSSLSEAAGKLYPIGVNDMEGEIIGVVKDFHNLSMHSEIVPMILMHLNRWQFNASVKVSSIGLSNTLSKMEEVWKRFSPDYPFRYHFLDEQINVLYQKEEQQAGIIIIFSILAIFLACLGLVGLASFTAEQKTKEIGIRKVFGAGTRSILGLLSKDYIIITAAANILAWPAAFYLMNLWLEDFVYKINITISVFIAAGLTALLIAAISVGVQTYKAASATPIKSLKYE